MAMYTHERRSFPVRQYWSMAVKFHRAAAMDMICVDLGPNAQDNAGDPLVVLWGEGLPVERIAEMTKVSAYELITRLTQGVA